MFKLLVTSMLFLFIVGCDFNEDETALATHKASYEIQTDCTTGSHHFAEETASDLEHSFCEALKDNTRNNNCGLYQREQLFISMNCSGTWPYNTPRERSEYHYKRYSFSNTLCSTGLHNFVAADREIMLRMYCSAIVDEFFNQHCAQTERQAAYKNAGCNNL